MGKIKRKMRRVSGVYLVLIFLLLFSHPVNVPFSYTLDEMKQSIKRFYNFYIHVTTLQDYYRYLEMDTPSFRLLMKRLKGKEKTYFLQMRPFLYELMKASQKTGIPVAFLASFVKRESQFNPKAVSNKGAYGLMGVTIQAYQDVVRLREKEKWIDDALKEYKNFSWDDVKTNPELNIVVGAIYYKFLLEIFENTTLACLAYNWGMGNVHIMQGKYKNTRDILDRLKELASFNSIWKEPAKYPDYILQFESVFQKINEKIKVVYATEQGLYQQGFALSLPAKQTPSS